MTLRLESSGWSLIVIGADAYPTAFLHRWLLFDLRQL